MAITVKDITTNFRSLKYNELKKLIGKSEFKDTDVIPLSRFAKYDNSAIQTYVAQREGNPFIALLDTHKQSQIALSAGITPPQKQSKIVGNIFDNRINPYRQINRDQSIFTLSDYFGSNREAV